MYSLRFIYNVGNRVQEISILFQPRECCEEVKIVYRRNNDVYERYPHLFTTYKLMSDNVTYMSKDDKYVLAVCDGRWMIQKSQNRYLK